MFSFMGCCPSNMSVSVSTAVDTLIRYFMLKVCERMESRWADEYDARQYLRKS